MTWKPSNEPTRYDRARVERTKPIEKEIDRLGLPLIRKRKLNTILNALIVQIEDGGDSPEPNRLLLEALRAAVRHQAGEKRARAVLRAIDAFETAEAERWAAVRAGTLPPAELTPQEQLDDLMQEGYRLLERRGQTVAACRTWLKAWEMVKQMATPDMRTTTAFDRAYPDLMQSVFNWCSDLEMELGNAGLDDPAYHEHRVRYVQEFLAQFPDEGENRHLNFGRAEAEALWRLGKRAEAEAVYQGLVDRFPDDAWGYIGWSDEYYLLSDSPKDYEAGEAILLQALDRPSLEDRRDALERLVHLYEEWGRPERSAPLLAELEGIEDREELRHQTPPMDLTQLLEQRPAPRPQPAIPKRNDPCWCGSGKKYKLCHMRSDRRRGKR